MQHRDAYLDHANQARVDSDRQAHHGQLLYCHCVGRTGGSKPRYDCHGFTYSILWNATSSELESIRWLFAAAQNATDQPSPPTANAQASLPPPAPFYSELLAELLQSAKDTCEDVVKTLWTDDSELKCELETAIETLEVATRNRPQQGALHRDDHPQAQFNRWSTLRTLALHLPSRELSTATAPVPNDEGFIYDDEREAKSRLKELICDEWIKVHECVQRALNKVLNVTANHLAAARFFHGALETNEDVHDHPVNRSDARQNEIADAQKNARNERYQTSQQRDGLHINATNELEIKGRRTNDKTASSQLGPLLLQQITSEPPHPVPPFQFPRGTPQNFMHHPPPPPAVITSAPTPAYIDSSPVSSDVIPHPIQSRRRATEMKNEDSAEDENDESACGSSPMQSDDEMASGYRFDQSMDGLDDLVDHELQLSMPPPRFHAQPRRNDAPRYRSSLPLLESSADDGGTSNGSCSLGDSADDGSDPSGSSVFGDSAGDDSNSDAPSSSGNQKRRSPKQMHRKKHKTKMRKQSASNQSASSD